MSPSDHPGMTRTVVTAPAAASNPMSLDDVLYALCRNKWAIVISFGASVLVAVAYAVTSRTAYSSQAKLLVRYVVDTKSLNPIPSARDVRTPDNRGENILNSELEIITSLDLLGKVADAVGPTNIVGRAAGVGARSAAIAYVSHNLKVEIPSKTDVIELSFRHPDPQIAQSVLRQLVDRYQEKHLEIHRAAGAFDFLQEQTDQLRAQLAQSEDALSALKKQAGILSLGGARQNIDTDLESVRKGLMDAESELASHQAKLRVLAAARPQAEKHLMSPASTLASAAVPTAVVPTRSDGVERLNYLRGLEIDLLSKFTTNSPPVKLIQLQIAAAEKLQRAEEKEQQKLLDQQKQQTQARLAASTTNQVAAGTNAPEVVLSSPDPEVVMEQAQIAALQAKIRILNAQMGQISGQATNFYSLESQIAQMELKRDLQETNYRYFAASLEQARVDEALETQRKVSNISVVEEPSFAMKDPGKFNRNLGIILGLGLAAGLGFGFAREYGWDRTVKRPAELRTVLGPGIPVFLCIPDLAPRNGFLRFRRNGHALAAPSPSLAHPLGEGRGEGSSEAQHRLSPSLSSANGGEGARRAGEEASLDEPSVSGAPAAGPAQAADNGQARSLAASSSSLTHPLGEGRGEGSSEAQHRLSPSLSSANGGEGARRAGEAAPHNGHAEIAPWDPEHQLRRYFDGLRDRLITYFETRNMTHKPKLVAVTSCGHGAGVTTLAAGLAASLSETGDGNVLLVDMNLQQGAAHPFHQGQPGCGLSEALASDKPDTALVQDNLYLVSAREQTSEKLPRALPKRFAHLVPKMKASDYDYIIFDMPPITQTSVTPRLAGLTDMVLMVVEAERTRRETVRRAGGLLAESRAAVAGVLNRHRPYLPQWVGEG